MTPRPPNSRPGEMFDEICDAISRGFAFLERHVVLITVGYAAFIVVLLLLAA